MEILFTFLIFMALMLTSVICNITMIVPLAAGIVLFGAAAVRRGAKPRALCIMARRGAADALVVVKILLLIGCLTGLWRCCGTISFITYYGVRLTPPHAFVLAAFLLSALMSYLLGTSFGVTATAGVILITIARAGGVSPLVAGGAILSGVYFGDRGSPAASSASLVANVTRTRLHENLRSMLRVSLIPMAVCIVVYALLSIPNALRSADSALLQLFEQEFVLSPWCLLPAAVLLILAFCGVRIDLVMAVDVVLSAALSVLVQKASIAQVLRALFLGFAPQAPALSSILSGGGLVSMLEICVILLLSSACSGVFDGTGLLRPIEDFFLGLSRRAGRFPAMVAASFTVSAVFCNQTIGVIMCRQLMSRAYEDTEAGRREMMLDISDSVIVIAGLVPWCIACSVPLKMLGCGIGALPFALYLYLIPIFHFFLRRYQEKHRVLPAKE